MPTTEWNQQAGMDGDANVENVANLANLATEAASDAEDSELAAAGSATAAAGSATAAAGSATAAAGSATLAGQHKTAAETAQGLAETAQGLSEGARDAALGYSNTASGHASNASISASNAAASYDSFDDRYLGAKSSDPTLDNDGDALLTGALYFNSTSDEMKVYNGSSWDVVAGGGGGSGTVTSVGMTVPTGLSVSGSPITSNGSLAVTYTAGYAIPTTAKQTQWDTAYGWGDHASAGYLTGFTETNDLTAAVTWTNVPNANITQASVTQHQSALSITESQISDLGAYLTTVALNDVSDVAITGPSSGQVLKYDGTNWVNGVDGGGGGGGIALTDLSVTTNSAGTAALSYNNVSGAFSYTPPDLSGYLTSYTETDTLDSVTDRNATTSNAITVGNLTSTGNITASGGTSTNWNTAYSWGNHATANYLTSYTETDPTVPSHVKSITTTEKANWNTAYSWGNHATAGYTSYSNASVDTHLNTGTATTNQVLGWNGSDYDWIDQSGGTTPTLDEVTDQGATTTNAITVGNLTVDGKVNEQTYSLTGTAINPANGTIQYKTLSANTTFTESLSDGEYVTLMIDDGTGYTITWPTMYWPNGVAPTLAETGYNVIQLWKLGSNLYGSFVSA